MKSNPHNKFTDNKLIALYRNSGKTYYVGILFQKYSHLISALAFKYMKNPTDTEDSVMEIFEILIRDLKKYDVKNFKSWLYSVTKNYCLKKKRKNLQIHQDKEEIFTIFMEFDNDLDHKNKEYKENQLIKMTKGVELLIKEQRRCIELFYYKDYTYKKIANETGFTLNQIKSYIQNGKRNLKNYLTDNNE